MYKLWQSVISRCYSENHTGFKTHGGKGIDICAEWLGDTSKLSDGVGFRTFLRDVGPRPTPLHSLDRKDNSRGYYPDNVRWATPKEQAENRVTTKLVTIQGETKPFSSWLRALDLNSGAAFTKMKRLKLNHTQFIEAALMQTKD